jgi:hypothetical protein
LLQSYSKRKHGYERGYADGHAKRGERIAKNGFAKIADGKFGHVTEFH